MSKSAITAREIRLFDTESMASSSAKKNESLPAVITSQVAGEGVEAGMLPIPPRADCLNCLRPNFLVCSLPPRAP